MTLTFTELSKLNKIATALSSILTAGDTIALTGDLGAGKTAFAKLIGHALGVSDEMTSPSYAIANVYDTPSGQVVHADVYRINSADDLLAFGFDEYFIDSYVLIIEWANKIVDLINTEAARTIWIDMRMQADERIMTVTADADFLKRLGGLL